MKKSKYLFLLRNKLLWKHSTRDINSIIFDYNEYFNIGLSNGKSENDMVIDLGSPTIVAKSLEDERDVSAPIKLLVRFSLGFMLILFTYIYLINVYDDINIIGVSLIFTILTPIGIWLLVGGDLRYKHIENLKISLSMFKKLIIMLAIFLVVAIVNVTLIIFTVKYIFAQGKLPFGIPNANSRIFLFSLFHFTSLLGAISIIQIIRLYRRTFINTLPLLFLTVGVTYSIQSLINKFNFVSSADNLLANYELWLCLTPFACGILTTITSYYLIRLLDKKGQ